MLKNWRALLSMVLFGFVAACGPEVTPGHIFTIGVLNISPVTEQVYSGFVAEMAVLGYSEDENIRYVYGGPVDARGDALRIAGDALVEAGVDLILAITTPAATAAMNAALETQTPVIFWSIHDPVAAGYAQDLQRPGGYMTGVTVGIEGTPTEGLRLEWLLRIAPEVERVYVPYNPNDRLIVQSLATVQEAAFELGIELLLRETPGPEEALAALESIPEEADAFFPLAALADPLFAPLYPQIIELTLQRQMPFSVPARSPVEEGALMSFGPEYELVGRQCARLADQILQGTAPGDLPVEIPEFFLAINLTTAEAIGLHIPDAIVRQADFVIR